MHVLVLGGSGYLGSTLTCALIRRGHSVRIVGRSLADARIFGEVPNERIEFMQGDISAPENGWFTGMDAMVLLAGVGSGPVADAEPVRARRENTDAPFHLATAAARNGLQHAILSSSTALYEEAPICADADLPNQPPAVRTVYARTKLDGEAAFRSGCADGIPYSCMRIGALYGLSPVMRFDVLVNALVKIALLEQHIVLHNGGTLWRPLIGVNDAAEAICLALENPDAEQSHTYDAVTENLYISDIAQAIAEEAARRNFSVRVSAQPVERILSSYRADTTALHRHFPNFQARQSVRSVVGEMLDVFLHPTYDRSRLSQYVYTEWNRAHAHAAK